MRKFLLVFILLSAAVFLLSACGDNEEGNNDQSNDGALKVVTSFTILKDLAEEIGGDDVDVHNLVPTGTDPHEFDPLPEDNKAATDADVIFYNGLNLEGGDNGWFAKLMDSVGQDDENIYSVTEHVEPMYISDEDGSEEEKNPHSFIDPGVGIEMAKSMRDALMEADPDNEEDYDDNAESYLEDLEELEAEYEEKLGEIPEKNRTLITSERAFQYLADHYDLDEEYIWAIDTEENGSPDQIKNLVSYVEESDVPALFVESNVDTRPMETVSKETDVPIYDEPIYSDEIGEPGEEADTYMKYLQHNLDVIYDGLK